MNKIKFKDEKGKIILVKIHQRKECVLDDSSRFMTRKKAFKLAARKGWTHPKLSIKACVVDVPKYL